MLNDWSSISAHLKDDSRWADYALISSPDTIVLTTAIEPVFGNPLNVLDTSLCIMQGLDTLIIVYRQFWKKNGRKPETRVMRGLLRPCMETSQRIADHRDKLIRAANRI